MLRLETETGYWLVTHPDHARLAGAFAVHWGNDLFARPEPRAEVLHGIHVHDDGWAARDASPSITRAGKPSAFSAELVGKYSAFEEIDLEDYLAVRERAVSELERENAYAALLVSLHTYNLMSERADLSTIAPPQRPLLDEFLARQRVRQATLHEQIAPELRAGVIANFRLLQACDYLSLLSCVAYLRPTTLLHPLATIGGGSSTVLVEPLAPRYFRLNPFPFESDKLKFEVPARHVEGHFFASTDDLRTKFDAAKVETLEVTIVR